MSELLGPFIHYNYYLYSNISFNYTLPFGTTSYKTKKGVIYAL